MEPMDPWPSSSSQIDGGDKKKADDILSTAVGSRDTCIELEQEHMSETSTTIDRASLSKKNMSRQKWLTFLIGDVYAQDDPRDLSDKRKNIVIFILALGGVNGPLGSMIYMPGLLSVARDLHTTISAVNGSVSAFVVFMGVAPLIWASLSDQYGRKRMYLLSNLLSLVASIICAFSQNIGMLIVFRALQSCGANAGLTLGAGVIADMVPVADRGNAYGFFYIGPLVGPVIGPTLGGFLCQYLGWQSTFYFSAAISGILFLMTAFLLPETLRKQKVIGDKLAVKSNAFQNVKRDLKPMLQMMQDWTVISITAYNAVIFSSLYFLASGG
ncbi:hypothetical protein VTP01DRAFT_3338 [Rhizomucor pusillus]|uniref:uncharacterized protein n=1 Tax=Rhizomucor pusillus TaxID=4840 RepID=UPI003743AA46